MPNWHVIIGNARVDDTHTATAATAATTDPLRKYPNRYR